MQILSDFSDRIPPMLVKELRQGLRAKAFVIQFLLFQSLMLIFLLSASSGADAEGAGSFISGVIFFIFGITAILLQPMRGTTALSAEITGNTMEMMVLTRLNSTRIVLGKWFSIVSQTALMLVTIIPYMILRYFFGGMNIIGEMMMLLMIFFTSAVLSALMVGLSAKANRFMRFVPAAIIFILASSIPRMIFGGGGISSYASFFSMQDPAAYGVLAAYVLFGGYLAWCALNQGIAAIAPTAENHSSVLRVVALVMVALAVIFSFTSWATPLMSRMFLCIIGGPAILVALTEPSQLLPPICTPFLKRGLTGRIASVFLYPGWPSGVFFTTLLIFMGVVTVVLSSTAPQLEDQSVVFLSLLGSLLLPALLATFFTKIETKRFSVFILFLLVTSLITILAATFLNIWHEEKILWAFIWNPSIFLPLIEEYGSEAEKILNAAIIVDAIILAGLLIRAGQAFRSYQPIIAEAKLSLNAPHE